MRAKIFIERSVTHRHEEGKTVEETATRNREMLTFYFSLALGKGVSSERRWREVASRASSGTAPAATATACERQDGSSLYFDVFISSPFNTSRRKKKTENKRIQKENTRIERRID